MKLDTTEAVLEWAEGLFYEATYIPKAKTVTAERIALAMRVLAIVENKINDDWTMTYGSYKDGPSEWDKGFNKGMDWMLELVQETLAEASAEKGEK